MPTVLIVEDDRALLARISKVLSAMIGPSRGITRVLSASSAQAALQIFDGERPDVAVVDILIPDMDGLQLCRSFRQRAHGKQVGLIITSSVYRDDPNVAVIIRRELRGVYLPKPYRPTDLATAVDCLLAERAVLEPPAPKTGCPPPPIAPPPARPELPAPEEKRTVPGALNVVLTEMLLPRILLNLSDEQATGLLTLRRGRVEKELELSRGHLIWITSNQREETLGNFLVSRRMISQEQHQIAMQRARDRGGMLGNELIALGALSAAQLVQCMAVLARQKVMSVLRWTSGNVAFQPDAELPERMIGEPIDFRSVVLVGLRDSSVLSEVAESCERIAAHRLKLTPRGERMKAEISAAFGESFARAVEDQPTVEDLLSRDLDLSQVLSAVEALLASGCVEPSAQPVRARTLVPVDPMGLESLSQSRGHGPARSPSKREAPATLEAATRAAPPDPTVLLKAPPPALFPEEDADEVDVLVTSSLSGTPTPLLAPALPSFSGDSGIIDVSTLWTHAHTGEFDTDSARARESLLGEYVRIQHKDWYFVLGIDPGAAEAAIEAAFKAKTESFGFQAYAKYDLGSDYGKLKELNSAYRRAKEILLISELRQAYDRQLARTGQPPTRDAFNAELLFREGERQLAGGNVHTAVDLFRKASELLPSEADYHAALGWSLHLAARSAGWAHRFGNAPDSVSTAEAAREQARAAAAHFLDLALEIDPLHAAAHEYRGRMLADLGGNEERAVWHLTHALECLAPRLGALEACEQLRLRSGQFRELEYLYRRLLHRIGERDPQTAYRLWRSLGNLYHRHLGNPEAAKTAYDCAARLGPEDPQVLQVMCEKLAVDPAAFAERAETLCTQWRFDRASPRHLQELVRVAVQSNQRDVAFVTASVLVAIGKADESTAQLYAKLRPSGAPRANGKLEDALLGEVAHLEDDADVSALFKMLEPVIERLWVEPDAEPWTKSEPIPPRELPDPFGRILAHVAWALGVEQPPVIRAERMGDRLELAGGSRPVLLAGAGALVGNDTFALSFRMARALGYARPGRTAAGQREGNVLRDAFLAAFTFLAPTADVQDPDGRIYAARAWLQHSLSRETAAELRGAMNHLVKKKKRVNLKPWVRGLARTADRLGLLLCGDPVTAVRVLRAGGTPKPEDIEDVLDFALSAVHLSVRKRLGLSLNA